jgi:hypothetical protein
VRILLRPRLPVLALLLFAPTIPELLTGSTPITTLFVDPVQFLVSFGIDIGLYGTGALLIREFVVYYRKGWASTLLLGAAYGIAEEGFAVHTFFQPGGSPVGALGSYGHAFGVNWLWALGLTVFHATYSIALPILLTGLWFPEAKGRRWLDRGAVGLTAAIYLLVVFAFALLVGHGPTPAEFGFFLAVVALLIVLALRAPAHLLSARPGPSRLRPLGWVLVGTLSFDAWVLVLLFAGIARVPAAVPAVLFAVADLVAIALVVTRAGQDDLVRSEYYFATGMLLVLFVWDGVIELSVPGVLLVAAVMAYLQYRLGRRLALGAGRPAVAPGPPGGGAAGEGGPP